MQNITAYPFRLMPGQDLKQEILKLVHENKKYRQDGSVPELEALLITPSGSLINRLVVLARVIMRSYIYHRLGFHKRNAFAYSYQRQ